MDKHDFVAKNNMKDGYSTESIYTELSVAKEEIWKRWNDKELRNKVEKFLDNDMPCVFKKGPFAVMVRHVASPNKEFFRFKEIANKTKLPLLICEFISDKFTCKNELKYHLCRMYFHGGFGKNGGEKIISSKIVNIDNCEGKKFSEIKTKDGVDFIDFHHKLLSQHFSIENVCDISTWLAYKGKKSNIFYVYYLALFLTHGVLFENFVIEKEEKRLIEKTVIPAIMKLKTLFGINPLIVPLLPINDERNRHWCYYPEKIKTNIST